MPLTADEVPAPGGTGTTTPSGRWASTGPAFLPAAGQRLRRGVQRAHVSAWGGRATQAAGLDLVTVGGRCSSASVRGEVMAAECLRGEAVPRRPPRPAARRCHSHVLQPHAAATFPGTFRVPSAFLPPWQPRAHLLGFRTPVWPSGSSMNGASGDFPGRRGPASGMTPAHWAAVTVGLPGRHT